MSQITSRTKAIGWVVITIVFFAGLIWWASSANKEATVNDPSLLTVTTDDYSTGSPTAAATLVEYLDFECEACGAYFPLIKQLEQDFPNDLRIVTRYFPLPGHRNGLPAALAVEAAARQNKYKEMHDLLFTEQKNWGEKQAADPALFEKYAEQLGLDMAKFKQDVASQSVKERVQRDVDSGTKLRNTGTPTFYLNGEKLQNPKSYEAFKAVIQAAISKKNQ